MSGSLWSRWRIGRAVRSRLLSAVLIAAAMCWPLPSVAGTADLSFDPPTTNDDGTPLEDLAGYRAYWGCNQSGSYTSSATISDPTISSIHLDALPDAGSCYFVVTAYNSAGAESGPSNEASKVMGAPAPFVTVGGPVYAQAFTRDALGMIAVGTVPAGVPCDPTQFIRAYGTNVIRYVVPGLGYPQAVVSECSR